MERGKLEGQLEGQSRLLRHFLVRRFGALPPWVEVQIGAATQAQIEAWFDRGMDAASLDAVFAPH